jgi:hypothetical protein
MCMWQVTISITEPHFHRNSFSVFFHKSNASCNTGQSDAHRWHQPCWPHGRGHPLPPECETTRARPPTARCSSRLALRSVYCKSQVAPHRISVTNPESSTLQRCRAFNDVVVGDNGDGVQHQQGSPFPSTCPNAFVAGGPQVSDAHARHKLTRLLQHLAMTL